MFKLAKDDAFWWTFQLSRPAATGEGFESAELRLRCARMSQDEVREFNQVKDTVGQEPPTDARFVRRFVRDWMDVVDADGAAAAFTPESLELVFKTFPAAPTQIVSQYLEAQAGEVRRKNS